MAHDLLLAFEDFIHGSASVYSSAFMDLRLAEGEAYAIQCVVEGIADIETTTVQLETSGDGRNWSNKNTTPEINGESTPPLLTTSLVAYDVGVRPALALLRLRVALFSSGGTPAARVRVYVRQTRSDYVNPARLPGCRLWLRSDMGVTLNASNAVSNWADQSGNGNDASQAAPGQQPTWTPDSVNGLPTLNFDRSTSDVLTTPAFALGTYTVVMVTSGQLSTIGWFWTRGPAGGAGVADTLYGTTGATIYSTRGGVTSARDLTASWGTTFTNAVLTVLMDGTHAGHRLRINGAEQSMTIGAAGDPGASTTSHQFAIAASSDSVLPSTINVAEVAIYNDALPAPELNALEEYARRRYRLY